MTTVKKTTKKDLAAKIQEEALTEAFKNAIGSVVSVKEAQTDVADQIKAAFDSTFDTTVERYATLFVSVGNLVSVTGAKWNTDDVNASIKEAREIVSAMSGDHIAVVDFLKSLTGVGESNQSRWSRATAIGRFHNKTLIKSYTSAMKAYAAQNKAHESGITFDPYLNVPDYSKFLRHDAKCKGRPNHGFRVTTPRVGGGNDKAVAFGLKPVIESFLKVSDETLKAAADYDGTGAYDMLTLNPQDVLAMIASIVLDAKVVPEVFAAWLKGEDVSAEEEAEVDA